MSLRDDKRRWTMREVQAAALDLFEANDYETVSVEAIAAAAGVSAPTIYRHFGTKERIILWDDYDPGMFAAIAEEARRLPPLRAVEAGLVAAVDRIYEGDARRILRRARLVTKLPALAAANAPLMAELRVALAEVLGKAYPRLTAARADLLAGIIVVTLETAVARWVSAKGKTPLRVVFANTFNELRDVVVAQGELA